MTIHLPIVSVLAIPTLYLFWRAARRDSAKIGADGLDDWFKAWAYVIALWASFFLGRVST